jgi:DNA repair protein SbcD/Mre11
MRASFIHIADTHLGYEQYGVRERFNDFSRAFWAITEDAVERKVDFLIIAGDLFNKRAIDAQTLIHAIEGLRLLKTHNIPVIAIEGNHDRSYYRDGLSWLQFLCYQQYLILLAPEMQDGSPLLKRWQPETMLGAYTNLLDNRLRIYGLPWQGSAVSRTLEGMVQALAQNQAEEQASGVEYRLLMMHTGVDSIVPRIQGLPTMAQFESLHPHIDYLALGHVHKPYTFGGWMYNPGSSETCSAEEVQWDDRGYYYVQIDTEAPEYSTDVNLKERFHHAERLQSKRRPFVRYDLRVDGFNEPDALYKRLEDYCRREGPRHRDEEARPVVQIHLIGTLGFDAGSLDQPHMEEIVRKYFQPLHIRIDNNASDQDYAPDDGELDGRDRSLWGELERKIFEDLVGRDNRYLPAKEAWSTVLAELKHQALSKEEPHKIAAFLREQRATLLP